MPRISTFYGITIAMYYREHGVPHFHARYGGCEASVSITTLEMIAGQLPGRALRLVRQWAILHREELLSNWERAQRQEAVERIDPLP
jgi:Domain of unknown function (DUF4160)